MSHLFSVGALVDVAPVAKRGRPNSEGGRGYVVAKRSSSPTSVESFDVEYIVPKKKLSKEVDPGRLSPAMIETVARRTRADADVDLPIQPSLLSIHRQASKRLMSTVTPSPPKRAKSTSILVTLVTTAVLLDRGRQFKDNNTSHHPILVYLQRNNHKDAGYLRRNDAKAAGADPSKLKSQLSSDERNLVLRIKAQLNGVVNKQFGVTQLIANAYGVSKRQINRWEQQDDQSRKQRKDVGGNILTSTKLQENWFSPLNCYKKSQRRQESTIANALLDTESDRNLKEQWDTMTPEQQKPYVEMSESLKKRVPFLIGEITAILKNSQGSVTWRQIETALSDDVPIISERTIRTIVMGLEDSQYTSTKLLPALTAAHIIKRKLWCQQFWIFWDLAKTLLPKKRILLVHMDEKWFFTVVVRMNNKLVPFLGMEKSDCCRSVHHKNYLKKLLCIATTAYLCNKNNIAAGGRGFHCKMMRAGHMEVATTTTYRRHTDANGKITYPKRDDNISRKAGESYFEPAEITANTREVRGKRKFSLQHDYWPVIFNYLDGLCRRLRYETGGDDIVVLYQWDGAGPHAKKELIEWQDRKFIKRGWIIRNQASQSPHLQVHDTSLFPSLSKIVSALQGLGKGNRVVDLDELWEMVQDAYYNRLTPEVIARAFAHHVQIVNAIYSCDGGDDYHRNGGLHCGVRRAYAPKYRLVDGEPIGEPIGVQLIETPEEETQQLRYDRPTPEELDLDWSGLFNRSQLEFLVNNLPDESAEYLQAEEALHGLDR